MQVQVDDIIADWYGFDSSMREVIAKGLDWTQRRKLEGNSSYVQT
jgi:hypothetical protein